MRSEGSVGKKGDKLFAKVENEDLRMEEERWYGLSSFVLGGLFEHVFSRRRSLEPFLASDRQALATCLNLLSGASKVPRTEASSLP